MDVRFSKPARDVGPEADRRAAESPSLYRRQAELASRLEKAPRRELCTVCGGSLAEAGHFLHRGLPFVVCQSCGHVLSQALPPPGFPHAEAGGMPFDEVYPRQDARAFADRARRVYKPKLDWLLEVLAGRGLTAESVRRLSWTDIGCGAGGFAACLRASGAREVVGIDADERLVERARESVPDVRFVHETRPIHDAITAYPADVYAAFFVLEHCDNLGATWAALRARPPGTCFAFSVPMFGFSCLLEDIFVDQYARNLDGVMHQQVFTDESIAYGLAQAGCEIVAQWVFGQDAEDGVRFLTTRGAEHYPARLWDGMFARMKGLPDAWQQVLDRAGLADQRHVLAIRSDS